MLNFVISITSFFKVEPQKQGMSEIGPILDNPTGLDIADALDAEIDSMWGLIAVLQTIFTEGDNPYIRGALRLANCHVDALAAIRRDVDRLDSRQATSARAI